jgi:phage terminase large subunit
LKIKAKIPEIFEFLFQPARYKVCYGGRGSGKSWAVADYLIIKAVQSKRRILCTREIQGSIKESVHKLLSDRIQTLGLSNFFNITESGIKGSNGSEFFFMGLLRNVDQIKSTEGITECWVEEGQNVSFRSWELITPTIRTPGSEIIITFNPELEDDETYQRFVINPPNNALIKQVNFDQNPYFPEELRIEMEQDKKRDHNLYLQKWEGRPIGLGGRVWANFDKDAHVKEIPYELIKEKGNSFCAVDPHSKFYPACIFYTVLPKNERMNWPEDFYIHVYNEYPNFEDMSGFYHDHRKKTQYDGTLQQLSTMIYTREGLSDGIKILKRFCDTRYAKGAGSGTIQTIGLMDEWAKPANGSMQFELPPEKMIDIQRERIKADMEYNKLLPISQFNEPTFSVAPRCQNLIASLKNHRLEIDKQGETKEKESEKYKDFSDALRIGYAGLHDFKYRDPNTKETSLSQYFPTGGSWNS